MAIVESARRMTNADNWPIRKGQACWSAASAKVGLLLRFILGLFTAMS
jgi:hypothetical protein